MSHKWTNRFSTLASVAFGMIAGALLTGFLVGAFPAGDVRDAAKLAPNVYKILLDNDKLRVIDYRLRPGEKEPVHSHPLGAFVYFLTEASTKAVGPQSSGSVDHKTAGDYVWREPVTHAGENIGKREIHALVIEPKSICK